MTNQLLIGPRFEQCRDYTLTLLKSNERRDKANYIFLLIIITFFSLFNNEFKESMPTFYSNQWLVLNKL